MDIILNNDWTRMKCYYETNTTLMTSGYQEYYLDLLIPILEEKANMQINEYNTYSMYNIPKEYLEIAGPMFIYWNLCPKFKYDWILYYKDLIQNGSPDIIALSLNRIMIIADMKKDKVNFEIAKKMVKIAKNYLPFKYPLIDRLTKMQLSKSFHNKYFDVKGIFDIIVL